MEVDDLALVAAKDGVHFPQEKQGQMGVGSEAAVGDEDVALAHFRMHAGGVCQIVRPQRRRHHAL
jgi:hypothetical protein